MLLMTYGKKVAGKAVSGPAPGLIALMQACGGGVVTGGAADTLGDQGGGGRYTSVQPRQPLPA